jgi:hypothetical protein
MKIKEVSSLELLAYSQVLENIIQTTGQILTEISKGVAEGMCTKEEVEKMYQTSIAAMQEADEKYVLVQKEMDVRIKSALGFSFGIRKVQKLIKDFDGFVEAKNKIAFEEGQKKNHALKELLDNSEKPLKNTMNVVVDEDNLEPEPNEDMPPKDDGDFGVDIDIPEQKEEVPVEKWRGISAPLDEVQEQYQTKNDSLE